MAKKSKNRNKEKKMTIYGPFKSKLVLPVGKLPIVIGSDRSLSANVSVYPKRVSLSVPFTALTMNVAGGAIANVNQINIGLVQNFATRFASLFDEYCLVGAKLEIRIQAVSALATGYVLVGLDEKNTAVGTSGLQDQPHIEVMMSNTESPSRYHIAWIAKDYLDLQWSSTGTSVTPVSIKMFCGASTGVGVANTATLILSGTLAFDFRGYS